MVDKAKTGENSAANQSKAAAGGVKKRGGALERLSARANMGARQEAPTIHVPLDMIDFDPNQPRIAFHAPDGLVAKHDQEGLEELAESLKINGLIHPITVSEQPNGRYLVRVGERRTRAGKLLGWATIEARVRNDLNGIRALALQMAENVDREALTDMEIALTIKRMVTKSEENPEPMTKKEAAEAIGKSPGYVTRYLTWLDDALREKWVTPGYVDSVETLYQVSLLPKDMQELAYAELSTGKREMPLSWRGLQYYRTLAKNRVVQVPAAAPTAPAAAPADAPVPTEGASAGQAGEVTQADAIAQALANPGPGGVVSGMGSWPFPGGEGGNVGGAAATADEQGGETSGSGSGDGYTLPEDMRKDLQVPTFQGTGGSGGTPVRGTPGMMSNTSVPCRMSVRVLRNLIAKFEDKVPDMHQLIAEVRFTSPMAVVLVRELTGEVVPEDVVLVKLAKALEALND